MEYGMERIRGTRDWPLIVPETKLLWMPLQEVPLLLLRRSLTSKDLKLENILVNFKDWELKLADFGQSWQFIIPTEVYTLNVCTTPYRAPELLLDFKDYTIVTDMCSVGCIFGYWDLQLTIYGQGQTSPL